MNALSQIPAAPGLWQTVWKLLRLRTLIFSSDFRRARLRRKIGILFVSLLLLGFLAFVFIMSWLLLRFLRSPDLVRIVGDTAPIWESVPILIFGGAFLGILLTSFGLLLQALYLAGDMDFLLSAPVPIRAVFITKMLQAILPNFGLIALFGLPVLYGMGAAGGYFWLYYPLVVLVLAVLALAAAGLSSLLVMFIVRIFPARRVAEVLGFLGAIFSFVCSQSGQLANFEGLSSENTGQAVQTLQRLNIPWSPITWAGHGLVEIGEGHWLEGSALILLTLGLGSLVFSISLITAERLYYSGWARMQGNRRKKKNHPARMVAERSWYSHWEHRASGTVRAIMQKDYLVLRRDLRNMSQLVTPLIFGIVYAVMLFRQEGMPYPNGSASPVAARALANLPLYLSVGLSLFIGWMLLSRLGGMGFSQEGKSYWLLKTAPVSITQLVTAKFAVAYLPAVALGWAFLLVISLLQRANPLTLAFTLPLVALVLAGNAGLALALGVIGANMEWDDPRHMVKGSIGCLSSLVTMVYLPVSLFLFFSPPLAAVLFRWPEAAGQAVGLLVGGVFSMACALLPPFLVRGRIARLAE